MAGTKHWGLITGHHYHGLKPLDYLTRGYCSLLGQTASSHLIVHIKQLYEQQMEAVKKSICIIQEGLPKNGTWEDMGQTMKILLPLFDCIYGIMSIAVLTQQARIIASTY